MTTATSRSTTRYLISTRPELTTCTSCGAPVLTAHAEGIPTTVDVTPMHRRGELLTVIEGRNCYALRAGELVHRDMHRLTRAVDLSLPEHRCHHPVDSARRTAWPTATAERADDATEVAPPW